jgi:tRNA(Ile)-lysidine synthase
VELAEGNVQAEARRARYAALAGWAGDRGLPAIGTAHHVDDQAETLLLRLNRASGVAGLAGVRPVGTIPRTDIHLLRPLLGWRKAELVAVVGAAGITPADDPSNADDRFDRARLRKALAEADWLDIPAIAASAAHLADADAALAWAAAREWDERVAPEGLGITYRPAAPRAIALRVISLVVARLDGDPPRGSAVARLFEALLAGRTASIGNLVARPTPAGWHFMRSPRRRGG